jgi:hypothetical protein
LTTERSARALGIAWLSLIGVGAIACQPNFGDAPSSVSGLRILAVSANPAEAAPGTKVTYDALVVDESGPRPDLAVDWAFCNEEKPLSDLNDISEQCFTFGQSFLVEIGQGPTTTGKLPNAACGLFGPDVPPSMAGMPPGRPTDPDLSGGYYQPVRLVLQAEGQTVLAAEESRILCDLPGATADTLTQFRMEYTPNQNPVVSALAAVVGEQEVPIPEAGGTISRGATVHLRASWPACPNASGCGAETYTYFDPGTLALSMKREALSLAWYATAGTFTSDSTGRASNDYGTTTDNTWTAPTTAGPVTLWTVLQDDRGGVSWVQFAITIT